MTNREWLNQLNDEELVEFLLDAPVSDAKTGKRLNIEKTLYELKTESSNARFNIGKWLAEKHHNNKTCGNCKWYKEIEDGKYRVCWLPFKDYPNGIHTVCDVEKYKAACEEYEEWK